MFDGNGSQKLIWGMAAVFIGGSIWLTVSWNRSSVNALRTQDVVEYQMPRPQAYRKGFDMSGRNVRTTVITPEKRKATVAALPPVPVPAATAPGKDKKSDKKKATKTAQKAAAKNKLRVAMVDTDLMMGMSGLNDQADSQAQQQNQYRQPEKQQVANDKKPNDVKKLSASEWRELLNTSPSFSNASDFRSAMMAGHISSASYYKIVEELLTNPAEDKSALAIYVLNQDGSLPAFQMLVINQTKVHARQQAAVKAMIENFSQSTRFSTLARALSSSTPEVAREATRLIDAALSTLNNTPSGGDTSPRGGRGGSRNSASTLTPASFAIFVMPLTRAASSGSPIASEASALLQRIQALI